MSKSMKPHKIITDKSSVKLLGLRMSACRLSVTSYEKVGEKWEIGEK